MTTVSTHFVSLDDRDDRARVLRLIAEYMPELDAEARLRWLYLGNPHGRALVWLAIERASSEIMGFTTFVPRRMLHAGREIVGSLGGDNFVRPSFRRRGVGTVLHEVSRRDMAERNIEVMFGTAMPANVTPLRNSGALVEGEAVRFVRPIHPGALGSERARELLTWLLAPSARGARLEPMIPHDPRVDEAWDATRGELSFATVRDAEFYTWRFLESPSRVQRPFVVVDERGRTLGAVALEQNAERLRIVDIVAPARAWDRVLGAAHQYAPRCRAIDLKLTRDDASRRRLWLRGFVPREGKPITYTFQQGTTRTAPKGFFFTWAEAATDRA